MPDDRENISLRKKEHLELCLTDKVKFQEKTPGFEKYDFEHYAITEVELSEISLSVKFFNKKISYPFLISSMTGGAENAEAINSSLASAAKRLNIPFAVGSQRPILENAEYINSYKVIRKQAPDIPVLGNLGAAQIVRLKSLDPLKELADSIEADAFIIHVNPLQELLQKNGEPGFKGLLHKIEKITCELKIPIIIKEVGAGISEPAAKKLIKAGIKGIDVAGAGGTSWAGVEILRNKNGADESFWDWGLPTTYCIRTISPLKKKHKFLLIASGGINSGFDIAKAIALGADMGASARIVLQTLEASGVEGVERMLAGWFEQIRKIMFLTGCRTIKDLQQVKLINKKELF